MVGRSRMNVCGIYQIKCLINGFIYIGSSYRIQKRWKDHKRELNENRHSNKYLQAAWLAYGDNNFKFEILELCEKELLLEREQYWMDSSNCLAPNGYNLLPKAGSRLGTKHNEETLKKLRAKVISDKHKQQISAATKGRKTSKETKLKIKLGNLGKKNTEQAKSNMRQAWAKRKGELFIPINTPMIIESN